MSFAVLAETRPKSGPSHERLSEEPKLSPARSNLKFHGIQSSLLTLRGFHYRLSRDAQIRDLRKHLLFLSDSTVLSLFALVSLVVVVALWSVSDH